MPPRRTFPRPRGRPGRGRARRPRGPVRSRRGPAQRLRRTSSWWPAWTRPPASPFSPTDGSWSWNRTPPTSSSWSREAWRPSPILHLADVNTTGNERGLLGVAVDPGWPARPYLYFHFTRTPGNVNYMARWTAARRPERRLQHQPGPRRRATTSSPTSPTTRQNHNGGTLRFGPDGMLYASVGEDADNAKPRTPTDLRGVILRLDVSGLPATRVGPPAKSAHHPAGQPLPGHQRQRRPHLLLRAPEPVPLPRGPLAGTLYIGDVGNRTYEEMDEATRRRELRLAVPRGAAGARDPGLPRAGRHRDPDLHRPHRLLRPDAPGRRRSSAAPDYRPVSGGPYSFPALYDGAVFFADYYDGFLRVIRVTGDLGAARLGARPAQRHRLGHRQQQRRRLPPGARRRRSTTRSSFRDRSAESSTPAP